MSREFILFITDDLRPYLSVLELGLQSLERQMSTPFFQYPATRIGYKPHFARIILSDKAEALLQKLKKPQQTEQEVLYAALFLAKKEREESSRDYQSV